MSTNEKELEELERLKSFLNAGGDINHKDIYDWNILSEAIKNGNNEVVELLSKYK